MRGRKKSAETRAAILRCAAEVFSQRPYHEVLTDEISARLKMGKGTLYRYFPSKEELYFATLVDGLQGMQDAIDDVLREPGTLEDTIDALTSTIIGYFWQRRDFFVLLHRHETRIDPSERVEWQQRRELVVEKVGARIAAELGRTRVDPRLTVEPGLNRTFAAELVEQTGLIVVGWNAIAPQVGEQFLRFVHAGPTGAENVHERGMMLSAQLPERGGVALLTPVDL